jgi:hypothetical protein
VLSDDLLRGAPAIAEYLGPAFTARAIYHLAEKQAIPVFRLPNNTTLYARKSELDRAFQAAA